jgi:hypothetical protein
MAKAVARMHIPVVILGPSIKYQLAEPAYVGRFHETGDPQYLDSRFRVLKEFERLDKLERRAFSDIDGVAYISIRDTLCIKDRCPMIVSGAPMQYDEAHLTSEASLAFGEKLWPRVMTALTELDRQQAGK